MDELARHYLEPDDSPVTDPPLHHSRLSRVGRPTSAGPTRAERGVAAILLAIGAALALFVLISLTRPGATQAQGPASPETTIPEQTEGQKQGHAYLEGTSNTANATLYFQDPSGSTESIDCSPDSALVTLSPGRYLVWIQDSGGKIIAQKRLVQADPGQTIYVGPDRSP